MGSGRIDTEYPCIDSEELVTGINKVPVTVDDNGTIFKTTMFAG
jgi:hypothetical protein